MQMYSFKEHRSNLGVLFFRFLLDLVHLMFVKTHEQEMWSINFLISERLLFLLKHDTSLEVHILLLPPAARYTE